VIPGQEHGNARWGGGSTGLIPRRVGSFGLEPLFDASVIGTGEGCVQTDEVSILVHLDHIAFAIPHD
jgi:hypothetical protein